MRSYTIAVAALALDVELKWLDNVMSHHVIKGIERKRQGIQRQIPADALLVLAVARELLSAFSLPIGRAIAIAEGIAAAESGIQLSPAVTVQVDLRLVAARLNSRLAEAVESAGHKSRGRPPR